MDLDVRTIFVLMTLNSVLLACSLVISMGKHARTSVWLWTSSLALQAAAYALYALRGALHEILTVAVANALLFGGLMLLGAALGRFNRRPLAWYWIAFTPLAFGLLTFLLMGNPPMRVAVGACVLAIAGFVFAWWGYRFSDAALRGPYMLITVGLLAFAGAHAFRVVVALVDPQSLTTANPQHVMSSFLLMFNYCASLVSSLGFLILHHRRTEEQGNVLAATDPLTGVYNRRIFVELGEKEFWRSVRNGTPLSLIVLDLDHFKRINDRYGHMLGDEVLKRFVARTQDCLRAEDLLVRYGGEEFFVMLPNVDAIAATELAERIRKAIAAEPIEFGGRSVRLTTSAGVACIYATEQDSLSLLIGRADQALYAAKSYGRNRVEVFSDAMETPSSLHDFVGSVARRKPAEESAERVAPRPSRK